MKKDEIQALIDQSVECAISSYIAIKDKPRIKKHFIEGEGNYIDVDAEIANWILLEEAYNLLHIDYNKWYKKFRHLIRYKSFDRQIYVYKPSILEWFEKDNINNKEKKRPYK